MGYLQFHISLGGYLSEEVTFCIFEVALRYLYWAVVEHIALLTHLIRSLNTI